MGHSMRYSRFYLNDPLPAKEGVDLLVIMGGPMSVYDLHSRPRMKEEIEWVTDFIRTGRPVLGICLGAQIIAASLGSNVFPGNEKEIGWHTIRFLPALEEYNIPGLSPGERIVFHWHGDTFTLPQDAVRIASSEPFPDQGFIYKNRVLALQFHLEVVPSLVKDLVNHCRSEIIPSTYIQTGDEILAESSHYKANQRIMFSFLDFLSEQAM
jgi:GMP synthase-like glutamine amidotransferase